VYKKREDEIKPMTVKMGVAKVTLEPTTARRKICGGVDTGLIFKLELIGDSGEREDLKRRQERRTAPFLAGVFCTNI
jgi:hypothetical protein